MIDNVAGLMHNCFLPHAHLPISFLQIDTDGCIEIKVIKSYYYRKLRTLSAVNIFAYLYKKQISMTDLRLFTELSSLPKELKKEVQDFIEFLKTKVRKQKPVKQREFGAAKGFFIMHENFDEPLEDFKDYV